MKRNRRRGLAKERILMVASSVLVLASLTVTGIWLGKDGKNQDQGYVVDLSSIENNTTTGLAAEEEIKVAENLTNQVVPADDLDYDPYFQETNSQKVENPNLSQSDSQILLNRRVREMMKSRRTLRHCLQPCSLRLPLVMLTH